MSLGETGGKELRIASIYISPGNFVAEKWVACGGKKSTEKGEGLSVLFRTFKFYMGAITACLHTQGNDSVEREH